VAKENLTHCVIVFAAVYFDRFEHIKRWIKKNSF
jgi:hypothetical protein